MSRPDPAPPAADASVRLARATEVDALAAVQVRALRAYGRALGSGADVDPAQLAAVWREAVVRPPTARHRVLVALAGSEVVGFAATGPNEDPDAEPGVDGEVLAFAVDPDRRGRGHGSRLLSACADTLRSDGFARAVSWLLEADVPQQEFFASAGWAEDGARRELGADDEAGDGTGDEAGDDDGSVRLVRLHTDLTDLTDAPAQREPSAT